MASWGEGTHSCAARESKKLNQNADFSLYQVRVAETNRETPNSLIKTGVDTVSAFRYCYLLLRVPSIYLIFFIVSLFKPA